MTAQRWWRAARLVLFIGFAVGVVVYLLGRVGTSVIPSSGSTYHVEADVPSSFEMAQAADVREAGVLVGRVAAVRRAGTVTALELAIDPQYAPIYRNATVLIRAKSIADEKYVQLDPGTPQAGRLADGSVLSVSHALQAVQ
ncbi:MAG TPA: MlaD family protein, partial [Solirubrobacteraceae bacterium]|nr:MlaD family protein [Solirubrobacteraceae bacterium]